MNNHNCNKCNVVANSLTNSCPACGTPFYSMNERQKVLGIATLVCVAIATGFFTFGQSFQAIAG